MYRGILTSRPNRPGPLYTITYIHGSFIHEFVCLSCYVVLACALSVRDWQERGIQTTSCGAVFFFFFYARRALWIEIMIKLCRRYHDFFIFSKHFFILKCITWHNYYVILKEINITQIYWTLWICKNGRRNIVLQKNKQKKTTPV